MADRVIEGEAKMKLSEQQAHILFDILKYSCRIGGNICGYERQVRLDLVSEILNQQSDEIIELDKEKLIKGKRKCKHIK